MVKLGHALLSATARAKGGEGDAEEIRVWYVRSISFQSKPTLKYGAGGGMHGWELGLHVVSDFGAF